MKIKNTYIVKDSGNNHQFIYECENGKFFRTEFVYAGSVDGFVRALKEIKAEEAEYILSQQQDNGTGN